MDFHRLLLSGIPPEPQTRACEKQCNNCQHPEADDRTMRKICILLGKKPPANDPDSEIARGCVLERPKVVFCPATGMFVMWFHLELKGRGRTAFRRGIASRASPPALTNTNTSFRCGPTPALGR